MHVSLDTFPNTLKGQEISHELQMRRKGDATHLVEDLICLTAEKQHCQTVETRKKMASLYGGLM